MEVCYNHDIAYEGRSCPMCEMEDELEEVKKELDNADKRIDELEDEIRNME